MFILKAELTFYKCFYVYLIISLAEELQPLSSFVHKNTVQVASLHRADLNGLFSPTHDLVWADMSCRAQCKVRTGLTSYSLYNSMLLGVTRTNRCRHLAPLQDNVLYYAPICVDVDALVLIAQQHLHAVWAGQEHDCVWCHLALDLFEIETWRDELLSALYFTNRCHKTYVNGNINIIVVSRVHINGVEASARSIDDLQPLAFLHCQVDQDRPVWQIWKRLV